MGGLINTVGTFLGGGTNSSNFKPAQAPIINPVTGGDIEASRQGVQGGLNSYQDLINAIMGANGVGNQTDVYNRLRDVAEGRGPNPAQAMLSQATGNNISALGSLLAGQRGSSANPALAARTAARAGGDILQNAAGQGAVLQANQSLGALGQMGGLANAQAGQQLSGVHGYNAAQQGNQSNIYGAIGNANNANVENTKSSNSANAEMARLNTENARKGIGGIVNGIGGAISGGGLAGAAKGIMGPAAIAAAAHGGEVKAPKYMPSHLKTIGDIYGYWDGGEMPMSLEMGGSIPGVPEVKGDSPKNDTQMIMASPGEVVIPKSVMESDDPVKNAAKFIAKIQKQKGAPEKDFKEALNRAIKSRKSK